MRRSFLLLVLVASPIVAQPVAPDDPDRLLAELRQVARNLADSVKQFRIDLDREIALHDRGYRTADGRRAFGADADLIAGPVDMALPTVQKLITARMIASRRPDYQPVPLTDADHLQDLILEARNRVARANNLMRQFLVVPADQLNSRTDAAMKVQRIELTKARTAATDAAKKAISILPVDMPVADVPDDPVDTAWSLAPSGLPVGKSDGTKIKSAPSPNSTPDEAVLPIRLERGKRITLVHEALRLVAITDTGVESQSRRLFYQEEWVQRQGSTVLKRWAVAVNLTSGQQTMLRRYQPREFDGELDAVYRTYAVDFVLRAELPGVSTSPSARDIAAATEESAWSRAALDRAVQDFRTKIREAMAHSDSELDSDMPKAIRESLFAIRGHLAHAADLSEAENEVRRAVERVSSKAARLDALGAFAGGDVLDRETPSGDSKALLEALNRADTEMGVARSLQRDALAALPPDMSKPEAQFPAFMKDVIVRMRGAPPPAGQSGTVRCRQEVWRPESSPQGPRQVKRTITLIDIDTKTGNQVHAGGESKYYSLGTGETLESVFDQYSSL